jgi:Protein of unknown function (DUF1565)
MGQYRRSKLSKGSAEHEVRVRYRRRSVAIGVSLTLAIPLSAAALSGSADASTTAILHVATTGKDTNPCTAKEPCATITHAVSVAPSGGKVVVAKGTYDQSVVIEKPITLVGQKGAVVDGWGHDPGAPLLGVVYIGGPGGTTASDSIGGNVTVKGFTFEDPNPDGQTYGDDTCLQPIIIGIYDGDSSDVITITHDTLSEGSQDRASAYDGPVGIDTLYSWAKLNVTKTTITGVWQGILLEDNGPATVKGNTVKDLIPFDYPNSSSYLNSSPTEPEQCVAEATADGTSPYAPEGTLLLADDVNEGMSNQNVLSNHFTSYAGDGVDVASAYAAGHLSQVVVKSNHFTLGGFSGSGAINLSADNGGTVSGVTIEHNAGTVATPSMPITENDNGGPPSGGTITGVTEAHNRIS